MQKDPVCGMMVDEKKAKFTSNHGGKTIYFCSSSCKASFDKIMQSLIRQESPEIYPSIEQKRQPRLLPV